MAWIRALLLGCALLSGCASMTEPQCRSADWYQLGYRDGDVYGLRPQIDQYAYQCRAWVQASEGDYLRGWVDGYREFTRRVHASDCCSP
ncbi:MAG: DUF2799 domain-containing protein [Pseudomonadota bacterium]|nr:DUF2799 domain-containing protein [Pseudomonadota bacterium]